MQTERMNDNLDSMSLFHPPVIRSAAAVLNRALFSKTVPIAAARVYNIKNVAKLRAQLEKTKESLIQERLKVIVPDPDAEFASKGGKCLLLKPSVKPAGMEQCKLV